MSLAINVTPGGASFQVLLLDLVYTWLTDHHRHRHDRPLGGEVHRGHRHDQGDDGRGTPLADFIERNPTIVMLAPGSLLMIGKTIADGFGFHLPVGYIYAAVGSSTLGRRLNMLAHREAHPGEEKTPLADANPLKQ